MKFLDPKSLIVSAALVGTLAVSAEPQQQAPASDPAPAAVPTAVPQAILYPTALFPFEERGGGVKEMGAKVSDLLFANLVVNPSIALVERAEMRKILEELELNVSGAVSADRAVQVGQLAGAKLIVTGSVIEADKTVTLVAKVIGTETGKVMGESVSGSMKDDFPALVKQLSVKIAALIAEKAPQLMPTPVKHEDRVAAVNAKLGDVKRPTLAVKVAERHVGQATFDPAAQTELIKMAKECGFDVLDVDAKNKPDVLIEGQGFSEFALRKGSLVSVKARLEIKAVDVKSGKILATDRQNAVAIDLSEQIAGKSALQDAADRLAERILPKTAGK